MESVFQMKTFVPEIVRENVTVLLSALDCHSFDVRRSTGRDDAAAQEINNQGGIKRRPLVFEDMAVFDGRTAVEAVSMSFNDKGEHPTEIAVDIIKGRYCQFSPSKKFEVLAASLGMNLPDDKSGFRRFATEADILDTIRQGIVLADASLADTQKLLEAEGVSRSRITKLYWNASCSVKAQRIGLVINYTKKHPSCSLLDACKVLGFSQDILKTIGDNEFKAKEQTGHQGTKNFIRKHQPMLDSALVAIKRYGEVIVDKHRNTKLSGVTAINVAKAHAITAEKIKRYADDMVVRIAKEVQSISLGTHRF